MVRVGEVVVVPLGALGQGSGGRGLGDSGRRRR
jgi:hypothetical protein